MAPGLMMAASLGATGIGTAISASSTLAAGDYAQQAGKLQATQLRMNAAQSEAAGQRRMFDDQEQTRLAIATSRARAGASGVNPTVGSPLTNEGNLAARGSYHALMDLWNGQAQASGLQNQAADAEWNGEMKKSASRLTAMGTIASGVGQMASTYGGFQRDQAMLKFGYGGYGRM